MYQLLCTKLHMVLSTLNDKGLSQSAVVGYGVTNKLELIFGTTVSSRKAANLAKNPEVSAVIGWDDWTIQYEGTARQLTGDEIDHYTEIYFAKNPTARSHKSNPDERYYLITPRWLRHTNLTKDPWVIREISL